MHLYSNLKRGNRREASASVALRQLRILASNREPGAELPTLGRFRKHKAMNCGKTACPFCCNPRHPRSWAKGQDKLTLPERKAQAAANDAVADLWPTSPLVKGKLTVYNNRQQLTKESGTCVLP